MTRLGLFRGFIPANLPGSIFTRPWGSILNTILILAACMLACAWLQSPALAQHPGVHSGVHPGGPHVGLGVRMGAPAQGMIPRPRLAQGAHFTGLSPRGFVIRPGTPHVFRHRLFFGAPFFGIGPGWGFNALWWPSCGPVLGWTWGWSGGFNCYAAPFYGFGLENYVVPPSYENPVYLYAGERDLIWLYGKDRTVYGVTDYWFVNDQVHFTMVEDGATKTEHTIPYNQLDVQKTMYVNSHRGFRVVFRDEPWEQYLKNHPDQTPPDQPPPQQN